MKIAKKMLSNRPCTAAKKDCGGGDRGGGGESGGGGGGSGGGGGGGEGTEKWKCGPCVDPKATQCAFCENKCHLMYRRMTYPGISCWIHGACLHAAYVVERQSKVAATCKVCDSGDLSLAQCAVKNCRNVFHMSCAWEKGYQFKREMHASAGAAADGDDEDDL
jgi:hypothetical protein